jgi:nicotinamide riboside kinase
MAEIFRIAINGPESTGKSQLAADLARHFGCEYVPEIAREYLHQLGRPYEEKDLLEIARLQIDAEEKLLQQKPPVLICDTSLLVIKIWSHYKYGRCHPWIETTEQTRKYSLHLLTDIDLPWEDDPLREHPGQRLELFGIYYRELLQKPEPFFLIRGIGEERLKSALKSIQLPKEKM